MLLDIRKIFSGFDLEKERKVELDFSKEDFDGYKVLNPAVFQIITQVNGDELHLTIEGDVQAEAECARCLDPIQPIIHVRRDAVIERDNSRNEEEDLPINGNGQLNLYELCYTELVLAAPTVMLCSEDCEGICPVCGKKRSLGCNCVTQEIDDRLAILSQLLTD